MEITIVQFSVFDKAQASIFQDRTLEQIHTELALIWPTYHPNKIIHCSDARTVDVSVLKKFAPEQDYIRGIEPATDK